MKEKKTGRVGVIARFKPLHNGAYNMLEAVCSKAKEVIIGIGSANKYNKRNPFTAEESKDMIHAALSQQFSNYAVLCIPDFGHMIEFSDGQKWRKSVKEAFGRLDYFISANPFVRELLKEDYVLKQPSELIDPAKYIWLKATQVRQAMAKGEEWESLVPNAVAKYLKEKDLVGRFRREFGLQTLAELFKNSGNDEETYTEESMHARET